MGFQLFHLLFLLVFFSIFALAFGTVIYAFINRLRHEKSNNNSPKITVPARVVAKRAEYNRRGYSTSSSLNYPYYTNYFATFEVDGGDRMELCLSGGNYGLLVEGDIGNLTFQGTRFLSFERK